MNLKPIRIRKMGKGPQRKIHVTRADAAAEKLPDDMVFVRMKAGQAELTRAIAKYEERSHTVVLRSLIALGLRVYRHLSDQISPYAPADVDVSDDEIAAVAKEIRVNVARNPWAHSIKVDIQRVANDAFVID